MKFFICALILTFYVVANLPAANGQNKRIVCFWNSTSITREEPAKFNLKYLDDIATICTHFVYGFAGINTTTGEIASLNPSIDLDNGQNLYQKFLDHKKKYPNVTYLLGIGGDADPHEDTHKYLKVTESSENRRKFVISAVKLLNKYNFDGFDLAWQFPKTRIPIVRNVLSSFWQGLKKRLGYGKFHDKQEGLHRDGFTILIQMLEDELKPRNKTLSLSILPHVNASVYYDIRCLVPIVSFFNLWSFDKKTPLRNPHEPDLTAPIYKDSNGLADDSLHKDVNYWVRNGAPKDMIVIAIATFGRTWKICQRSHQDGYKTPVETDGHGSPGPYTQTPGFLSYLEICFLFNDNKAINTTSQLLKHNDFEYYVLNPIKQQKNSESIWVGYEDPLSAGDKGLYARMSGLGGLAFVDVSLDDFFGVCRANPYPILKEAKTRFLTF